MEAGGNAVQWKPVESGGGADVALMGWGAYAYATRMKRRMIRARVSGRQDAPAEIVAAGQLKQPGGAPPQSSKPPPYEGEGGAGGHDVGGDEVEYGAGEDGGNGESEGDSWGNAGSVFLNVLKEVALRVFQRAFRAVAFVCRTAFAIIDRIFMLEDEITRKLDGKKKKKKKGVAVEEDDAGAPPKVSARRKLMSFCWKSLKMGFHVFMMWNIFGAVKIFMANNTTTFVRQDVPYSYFVKMVRGDKVGKVIFEEKSDVIRFVQKDDMRKLDRRLAARLRAAQAGGAVRPAGGGEAGDVATAGVPAKPSSWLAPASGADADAVKPFVLGYVRLPPKHMPDPTLLPLLHKKRVVFETTSAPMSGFVYQALFTIMALWLPLLPFWFFLQRMRDGAGSPAKRNKNKYPNEALRSKTTFKDVAGCDAAKVELAEFVSFLQSPDSFRRLGAKPTSGILMVGPPGTGKTLLARALAGEAGVPFFSVSASEFVEMYVGRGAARVRQLFESARKSAPCVVFIDEIDAVGMKRGAGLNEERDQTVIQLLTELDGFDGNSPGMLVLAATNRASILDPALLRPGRLSRRIRLENPDEAARRAILRVHLQKVPFRGVDGRSDDAAMDELLTAMAYLTPGFSGAQLANVVNEAALLAARRGADVVTKDEIAIAISRTRDGIRGNEATGVKDVFSSLSQAFMPLLRPFGGGKPDIRSI